VTPAERGRYHQLHPAKLAVDWANAIAAGALLWRRKPIAAAAIGFGPSILASIVFLSGRADRTLEAIRSRPLAQAIAPALSPMINAMRFAGLAVAWAGCWLHRAWLIPSGLAVILGAWGLAWRRGADPHPIGPEP